MELIFPCVIHGLCMHYLYLITDYSYYINLSICELFGALQQLVS